MNIPSLPSYPLPASKASVAPQGTARRLSPRQVRVLIDLALLAGIVLLFLRLERAIDAAQQPLHPPEPLEFKLVAERAKRVQYQMMKEKDLFELLGPERYVRFREPEFDRIDHLVACHPDRYPGDGRWAKWADPADENVWVAAFISDGYVFHILKKGF